MPPADLVIAGYVLAELAETEAAKRAKTLWEAADQMLVLVEPGTPQGFARIRAARAALIAAGGHVVAPCTHDKDCPLTRGSIGVISRSAWRARAIIRSPRGRMRRSRMSATAMWRYRVYP